MKRCVLVLIPVALVAVVLLCGVAAVADDEHHHEDLTPDQLGTVHFTISCAAAEQKPFERGVALLHSFWYEEAEKEFVQIAKDDPKCAMAHWGIAMSIWHQLWNHPDHDVIARGAAEVKKAKSLHPRTGRERDYIAAMDAFYGGSHKRDYHTRASAYSGAMETVYQRNPEDHEAVAFYALSLLASEPKDDTTFVNRKKAGALLGPLFAEQPNHPGVAHYLIHTYDKPQLAELGLPAARSYAKIAPAAPHALHMPAHIFARLGLWQDDIDSNLASIAATRKTAAMHMGGESHQFHAMDFLVYAYLQTGREAEAQHVIDEVKAMPEMKDMYEPGFDPHISALVTLEASYVMELHHWTEAAALAPIAGADLGDSSVTYWARAIGAARTGNLAQAQKDLAEITGIHQKLVDQKKPFYAEGADQERQEALAWIDHAQGKDDDAIQLLRTLAEKDDGVSEASDEVPAREMLADMLLDMKRPEQALTEYEADLKLNPNRFDSVYGAAHAAEMAGKNDKANTYYAQLVRVCAGSNSDRPELSRAKALLAQK